jgi:hypothetical protein
MVALALAKHTRTACKGTHVLHVRRGSAGEEGVSHNTPSRWREHTRFQVRQAIGAAGPGAHRKDVATEAAAAAHVGQQGGVRVRPCIAMVHMWAADRHMRWLGTHDACKL